MVDGTHSHLLGGSILLLSLDLLWEQEWVYVGKHTGLSDGGVDHQLVEFLVVSHSKLDVAWSDGLLLVLVASITSQFEDFRGDILHDGCHENSSTGSDLLSLATLLEV